MLTVKQHLYWFVFIAVVGVINPLYSQSTYFIQDADIKFTTAKEYFHKEMYDLAMPIFKQLATTKNSKSVIPASIQSESTYYLYVIGLRLDDSSFEETVVDYLSKNENEPRSAMLAFELGEFYYRQKDYNNALAMYNKTKINNLSNVSIASMKFHKAYALFTLQQFADAKPLFNTIRQIPNDANYIDANYYYGFICFYDKQYDEALAAFLVAEKHDDYANVVPFYIAEIYYFKGEKPKSIAYAEAAIKRGNQFYDLQLKQLAGHLLFEKKMYQQAQVYLEEYVLKTEKVNRQDLYELSYCFYEAGNYNKAIEGLKQLGGKEDSLAQNCMYLLADAYLKTGQKANARNAFLFCESNNSNPTQKEISAFSYAKLSYELNYLDVALKEMQQFIVNYPNSNNITEAKELLIAVLSNTSNYRESLALFINLQKPSENVQKIYPRILFGRSVELLNDQKVEEADSILSKIMLIPYNVQQLPFVFFWKAEIAYRKGRVEESLVFIQNYLKDPKINGEVNARNAHYVAGYCLLKKGDYQTALTHFQQVAVGQISNTASDLEQDAYTRMGDCYYMLLKYKQAIKYYDDIYALKSKNADYALYQKAMIAGALNKSGEKLTLLNTLIQNFASSNLIADANLELGNYYLSDENWNDAIPFFQKVLNISNATQLYPTALLKKGLSYYNLNKNEEALNSFTSLVNKYPNSQESEEAIEYIRNIFVENQQPDAFVNFMKGNGKQISTSEADSLSYKSAMLRYEAKDFDNASKGFAAYINQFPQGKYLIEANYFTAEIALFQKNSNQAAEFYSKVVVKAPNKYAERSALQAARIYYFEKKDYANAATFYTSVKNLTVQQETKLEAIRGLLRCQYKLQQWKTALQNAQDLLNEKGAATDDKMMANMIVAKTAEADSLYDQSLLYYNNVIVLGKSEFAAEALYKVAEINFIKNKFSDAEKIAFDVIKKMGSYEYWVTKSYVLLGDIYTKQKDWFNAEATFKSIVENATIVDLKQEAEQKLKLIAELKSKSNKVE